MAKIRVKNTYGGTGKIRIKPQKYGVQQIGIQGTLGLQNSLVAPASAGVAGGQNNGGVLGGLGYLGHKLGLSALSTLEGIWDYTAGGIAKLFGADEWAEEQIANDWVNYQSADEWYDPSEGWRFAGDVAGGIGTSAVSIGAAFIPYVGAWASPVLVGLGAAGNATKEAYRQTGTLGGNEFGYGALSGFTEAALEKVTGALGAGSGRIASEIAEKMGRSSAKEITKTVGKVSAKKVLGQIGKDFAGEAFEEGVAEILSPIYKNVTYSDGEKIDWKSVGYNALVGGISGIVMGGGQQGASSALNYRRGNKAINTGSAAEIMAEAKRFYDTEIGADASLGTEGDRNAKGTGNPLFAAVRENYETLQQSLKETNGELRTAKQKMLVGALQQQNIAARLSIFVEKSAANIVRNAPNVATRAESFGLTDENGTPVSFTAEQLTEGVDLSDLNSKAGQKRFWRSLRGAMVKNPVLSKLAVMDATGHLLLDTQKFAAAEQSALRLAEQTDLNQFLERADAKEKAALAERLGIEDFNMLSHESFRAAVAEMVEDGDGMREFAEQNARIKQAVSAENAAPLPETLTNDLADGVYRADVQGNGLSVLKEGENFFVVQPTTRKISRALGLEELSSTLQGVRNEVAAEGRLAIGKTVENKLFVEIENDILDGVPESDWIKTVKSNLATKFPNGIKLGKNTVKINLTTRREMTFSKYMQWLKANDPQAFSDKLRATDNVDEILQATTGWINEGLNHPRSDSVTDFARGTVLIKVGQHDYSADVVVGSAQDGSMLMYDIINLQPTTITKKETSSVITGDPSREASRKALHLSNISITENAEKSNSFVEKNSANDANSDTSANLEGTTPPPQAVPRPSQGADRKSEQGAVQKSAQEADDGKARREAIAIDVWARENIPDYAGLNAPAKAAVRATVRNARAHGISNEEVLVYARVAARSGLSIAFDVAQAQAGDARYNMRNTIFVDPNAPASRRRSKLLLHEGGHALFLRTKSGRKLMEQAFRLCDPETAKQVREDYTKYYEKQGLTKEQYEPIIEEEIAAAGLESALGVDGAWEFILSKRPTAGEKLLSFFRGAARDYAGVGELSAEARKLLRTYQKAFAELSARNQGNNALTGINGEKMQVSETKKAADGEGRFALSGKKTPTYEELVAKSPIKIVDVKKGIESDSYANMKSAVSQKATQEGWFDAPHHNNDTDSLIFLTEKSFTHAYSNLNADFGEDTIRCMAHIPEIINEAVLVSVDDPKNNTKREKKVYTFFGAIDGKNGIEPVKLTVKEFDFSSLTALPKNIKAYFEKNGIMDSYNSLYDTHALEVIGVEGIKKESDASGKGNARGALAQSTSDPTISIANLLDLVKGEAEKYIPKSSTKSSNLADTEYLSAVKRGDVETAQRMVDEAAKNAGYSIKAYHGSRHGGFTVFDDAKNDLAQKGFFFSSSLDVAKSYMKGSGGLIYTEYIQMNNPLVVEGHRRNWDSLKFDIGDDAKSYKAVQRKDGRWEIHTVEGRVNIENQVAWATKEDAVQAYKGAPYVHPTKTVLNTTRDIVRYAYNKGVYDGVIIKDTVDMGDSKAKRKISTLYIPFESNQIKSADPVTYDDNGNVIPLSKRFDRSNLDMRFALPRGENPASSEGSDVHAARREQQASGKTDANTAARKSADTITMSKGQLAALQANYHGDKVFTKKDVAAAMKGVEAFMRLPAELRNEFINRLWTGYNKRLHAQGFAQFTEVMWHQLHATVLQENGFDMSVEEIAALDEQIVSALNQIVASGKQSIKARLEHDTSTEGYRQQANYWREEHSRVVERNKLLGRVKFEVEKLANAKAGRYLNAAQYRGDSFRVAITELAKMNWRGGLVRDQKIREHFAALDAWYSKDNPLYKGDGGGNELFRQDIKDALNALGNAQNGALTTDDLLAAESVIKYFAHEIEAHNTVYKNGKRVDAMPLAKEYVAKIGRAAEISGRGLFTRSSFARLTADPALLMRQADGYLDGFFTEQFEELRRGTIDAAVTERELAEEFEKFWSEHEQYGKRYNNATVSFDGKEMPLQEAISLYMTMKREHAHAGLAGAGFEIEGKRATQSISEGFADEIEKIKAEEYKKLPPEELLTLTKEGHARIEQAALKKAVEQKSAALEKQFTAEDKALIAVMERGLEAARKIKVRIDEIIQGYSNVTGGYYFPIRRTGLAENVDAFTGFEGDRVSNLSINKDTVKNAHKLLIEPVHVVYMRHLKAISLYEGLGVFTDNFNRLFNLNITDNANNPLTVRTELSRSNNYTKEMLTYFKEMKQDVEGISKKRATERFYNDAVAYIRSAYATYQLGFNPKVWVTQLSSFVAATNMLDADCLARGLAVSGKDVDEYCRLAWLRNNDNAAAMAQAVSTPQNAVQRAGRGVLQKIRSASTWMIGKMDRLVVRKLFAACQVQVEKNGGAKVGTKENKVAAGEMLTRVILETQQNSLMTERSAAMRSGDELLKGSTMFSADAMKITARAVETDGKLRALKHYYKEAKKAGRETEAASLQKQIKAVRKQQARAMSAFVGVALFNAALAYAFKWLYRRDEEEDAGTFFADTFGNMLGGIPFVRDAWGLFYDGYEADHFAYATFNDVLGTVSASYALLQKAADGEEITRQQTLAHMRKILYAMGQLTGVPVRNIYNVSTGMINRISPETGYEVDSLFYQKNYRTDLQKALEAEDEERAAFLLGLVLEGETQGEIPQRVREEMLALLQENYGVLPRATPKSYTKNGETVELDEKQQAQVAASCAEIPAALNKLFGSAGYQQLSAQQRAEAIGYLYDLYRAEALTSATGEEFRTARERVAGIVGQNTYVMYCVATKGITSDVDKNGETVAGSKRKKVVKAISALPSVSVEQRLLLICASGYAIKDGDVRGLTATAAKKRLLRYILSQKGISAAQKAEIAEMCGFEVKNGRIRASSVK